MSPPAVLMRLTDDVLIELHDTYLGGANAVGLAGACRRLRSLLRDRFAVVDTRTGALAATATPPPPPPVGRTVTNLVWHASVVPYAALTDWAALGLRELTVEGGPCRDPAGLAAGLAACVGLRRFRWTVDGGRPGADPETPLVLRAAARLPRLEALEVCFHHHTSLDRDALDTLICEPIRSLRRCNRLRSLTVDIADCGPRVGAAEIGLLAEAISVAPAAEGAAEGATTTTTDRLERLRLILWDVVDGDALAACAPIGACAGLRHLVLDAGGLRRATPHGVCAGLVDGVFRDGGAAQRRLRTLDLRLGLDHDGRHSAARDLFAALGRCRALGSLTVDLGRCSLDDRDVERSVLAPLVAGGERLTDLSLSVGGAVLGPGAVDRLTALVPRLRSLVLRGVYTGASTARRIFPGRGGGPTRLHRFEMAVRGWINDGLPDASPRWPAGLGALRIVSQYVWGTGHTESLFRSLGSGGSHLTDVHIGLWNTGMRTEFWENLCVVVGGLSRLRSLHLDVRRNEVRTVVAGIDALTAADRLTRLRLLFDGNPLTAWTDAESAAACCIPDRFPRLCSYHLSLRDCSLPYGVTARIALYSPEPPRLCRVAYSF